MFRVAGFTFVGVSAEPTWISRKWLLPRGSDATLFGCLNDTYGYLASPAQQFFGGYESNGFLEPFGLKARRRPLISGLGIFFLIRREIRKNLANLR